MAASTAPLGEIQTVFVAGLPYDATDRELYLLFGSAEGYDKSMIVRKDGGKRPYGFVNFTNSRDAAQMKDQINGFQWDPNDPIKLKAELSKRNTPDWFTAACSPSGSAEQRKKDILARQPKTLYITGLPRTVGKELFEALVTANFPGQVPGMRYTPRVDQKPAFAFVGFHEHQQAKAAMERLEGYVWTHEGVSSAIHASFANTEFNTAANETASTSPSDQANRVPGYRTMHIAYLPYSCTKETLERQLEQDFPAQVEAMRFQQKTGKQPFAFVLFKTADAAGQAINRYHGNVWEGAQLKASQARTELDVTRLASQA
ncbi:Protein couch potato [Diplonema papillatum]|nr:Protein couch potato [Diplonema papillatum]|eukprot:gene4413-6837_t